MAVNGWTLPPWIVEAIEAGTVKVVKVKDKRFGEYECLYGSVIGPHGVLVNFL
jgi:hypothetical protein